MKSPNTSHEYAKEMKAKATSIGNQAKLAMAIRKAKKRRPKG